MEIGDNESGEEELIEPVPLGMFVYQYVMGNLHNIMIDLAEELNMSGTNVITKDQLQEKLYDLPEEDKGEE